MGPAHTTLPESDHSFATGCLIFQVLLLFEISNVFPPLRSVSRDWLAALAIA